MIVSKTIREIFWKLLQEKSVLIQIMDCLIASQITDATLVSPRHLYLNQSKTINLYENLWKDILV